MRILITGGTGLIGSALAAELAGAGHEVIVLSRNPDKAHGLPKGVRAERWDGRTAEGWGPLADGAGAIVNLAGASIAGDNLIAGRWTEQRKRAILESRTQAGQAVVAAVKAARQKPGAVIQSSAVGYYGPHGDEPVTEDTPAGSDFLAGVCVAWEASTAEVASLGVRHAVSRTGILLANEGGAFPPLKMITNLGGAGPMGSGRQVWPWIHLADEIAALRHLVESNASGPYNLCAPNPVSNRDFMKTLAKVMHRPSFLPTPAFALRLMAGELADALLLNGARQLPKKLERDGFKFRYTGLEPALKDLVK
ncbi:MAG: TIGR01777 family oxidoreductase [Anaerolineales bacterium]